MGTTCGCGAGADVSSGLEGDIATERIDFQALRRAKTKKLSVQETKCIDKIFQHVDTDQSKTISKPEIRALFEKHNSPLTDAELNELMEIADTDKSGEVDMQEFRVLMKKMIDCKDQWNGNESECWPEEDEGDEERIARGTPGS